MGWNLQTHGRARFSAPYKARRRQCPPIHTVYFRPGSSLAGGAVSSSGLWYSIRLLQFLPARLQSLQSL
eukprot:scaffold60134_cov86-Phaeocystis_antarctica.AAC.1